MYKKEPKHHEEIVFIGSRVQNSKQQTRSYVPLERGISVPLLDGRV